MHHRKSRPALDFCKYLCRVLNKTKCRNVDEWKLNRPVISREAADLAGFARDGRVVVLLEIERLREDPASNVVKIWKWITDEKGLRNVILIHAFSKPYPGVKEPRMVRAKFVGEEM